MAKFPFKRPRIISKKFPELDSSIDGVTKSLNDLVFSYHEQVSNALSKKHWLMAFSSIALLLVLGSFISMRGKAESSIFYPETCLGGWINPQYAQGEQQTTSNGDETQFTKDNSAVLPKNTNAEMYCGNFKGKFDVATKPTKIIVSLALTKGEDLKLEDTLESGLVAGTSTVEIDIASSTSSSTLILASSTNDSTGTTTDPTSASSSGIDTSIATPGAPKNEGPSILEGVVKSVQDTIHDLFGGNEEKVQQTDTVVVPPPATKTDTPPSSQPEPQAPATESPTSFLPSPSTVVSHFVGTVFAQEEIPLAPAPETITQPTDTVGTPETSSEVKEEVTSPVTKKPLEEEKKEVVPDVVIQEAVLGVSSSTLNTEMATASDTLLLVGTSTASTTEIIIATSTQDSASSTNDNQFQNNFLEVLYTFDGITWTSLGELNEISMKYRTFEIPVTASTSWNDLDHLQVKVQAKKREKDTPTVYLDGIKVEVLYESEIEHMHPDFKRDTILKDEIVDGMRILTIINNDTNREEVWYMYLEEENGTSTLDIASSTLDMGSSTEDISTTTTLQLQSDTVDSIVASSTPHASSTAATSTPIIKPTIQKNVWFKFDGKAKGLTVYQLILEIKKMDEIKLEEKDTNRVPDFTIDKVKKIKGTSPQAIVVQIEKENIDELWIYDIENNTQEKIQSGSSTSISSTYPLGVKGGHLFWLSNDEAKVFAYNFDSKVVAEKNVPPYDGSKGERAQVIFEEIPWKVIVSNERFSFFSESTGEVFSDENSTVVEAFRKKLKLDSVLDTDEINYLNLPAEEKSEDQAVQQ